MAALAMTTNNSIDVSEDGDLLAIPFLMKHMTYRKATPTDILKCVALEKSAYHPTIAASKNVLQYRQHYAAPYFRCAVFKDEDNEDDQDLIIGFISGTRVPSSTQANATSDDYILSTATQHDHSGSILVIQSLVIRTEYRDQGLGNGMLLNYVEKICKLNETSSVEHPIAKIVVLTPRRLLNFYLDCGFSVLRPAVLGLDDENDDRRGDDGPIDNLYYGELSLLTLSSSLINGPSEVDLALPCYIVDSFAAEPGTGNPAAIVLLPDNFNPKTNQKWMQKVASEFNLAETAFCWPRTKRDSLTSTSSNHSSTSSQGGGVDENASTLSSSTKHNIYWNIRFYTPTIEMPLCGHATLASAAILYQTLNEFILPVGSSIVFHASENILTMRLASTDDSTSLSVPLASKVSMDFPPKPSTELSTREEKASVRNMLKSAFSVELDPLYVGLSDLGDLLVELSPQAFHDIGYDSLNYKAFLEWDGYYRGVVICCDATTDEKFDTDASSTTASSGEEAVDNTSASKKVDFLSRFFAPKAGINEDPVTGSAHCILGPYYSKKLGKEIVIGRQMSQRRGIVECKVTADVVTLTGTAITTMCGKLHMDRR
jgi:predicted PhzF superfamily epimerase YddE/YHI9/ribosomal protein S18 acetylase RimI-like enzyme